MKLVPRDMLAVALGYTALRRIDMLGYLEAIFIWPKSRAMLLNDELLELSLEAGDACIGALG